MPDSPLEGKRVFCNSLSLKLALYIAIGLELGLTVFSLAWAYKKGTVIPILVESFEAALCLGVYYAVHNARPAMLYVYLVYNVCAEMSNQAPFCGNYGTLKVFDFVLLQFFSFPFLFSTFESSQMAPRFYYSTEMVQRELLTLYILFAVFEHFHLLFSGAGWVLVFMVLREITKARAGRFGQNQRNQGESPTTAGGEGEDNPTFKLGETSSTASTLNLIGPMGVV